MRAKLHPIFILGCVFLLLSPVSVATGLSIAEPAKYMRLFTTVIIVLLWGSSSRTAPIGKATRALMGFVGMFTLAGLWSDMPHWALFHKGMFALTCFSGMALVGVVRSSEEFSRGLRLMGTIAAAAAVIAFAVYWKAPGKHSTNGRMALWGINANMIGQTAAPLFILAAHVVLHDRTRWRWLVGAGCAMLILVIVGTGSRGAALMAGIGALFLFLPFARRPSVVVGIGLLFASAAYIAFEVIEVSGGDRMVAEMTKDTRGGMWSMGWKHFVGSPLIGNGWLHWDTRWASTQNIYLQTLVETGILGGVWLGLVLLLIARRWLSVKEWLMRHRLSEDLAYLSAALVGAVLLHGVAESSTFQGTSAGALLLGMGVALIDRIPEFAASAHYLQGDTLSAAVNVVPQRIVGQPISSDALVANRLRPSEIVD